MAEYRIIGTGYSDTPTFQLAALQTAVIRRLTEYGFTVNYAVITFVTTSTFYGNQYGISLSINSNETLTVLSKVIRALTTNSDRNNLSLNTPFKNVSDMQITGQYLNNGNSQASNSIVSSHGYTSNVNNVITQTANQAQQSINNGITYTIDYIKGTVSAIQNGKVISTRSIQDAVSGGLNIANNTATNANQSLDNAVKQASSFDYNKIPLVKDIADTFKLSLPLALMGLVLFGVIILKK